VHSDPIHSSLNGKHLLFQQLTVFLHILLALGKFLLLQLSCYVSLSTKTATHHVSHSGCLSFWPEDICILSDVVRVPNWIWCQHYDRITNPLDALLAKLSAYIQSMPSFTKPARPAKPKIIPTIRGLPRILFLLGLQAAASQAHDQPDIHLSSIHKNLRKDLRKYRKYGMLNTPKLPPNELKRLQAALEDLPQGLLTAEDSFPLIFDTGCSKTATGFKADFDPGSLHDLPNPLIMTGIAGGLEVTQVGTVSYDVQMPNAEITTIQTDAYYMPHLKCRLISPQSYQQFMNCPNSEFSCKLHTCQFRWKDDTVIDIPYDPLTFLPTIRAYKDAISTAISLGLSGCVTEETNQNLSPKQKLLLRFHHKLGHIGFATIQWLGRQGWLGSTGVKMGHSNLPAPKCAACLYGKQGRTPCPSKHSKSEPSGALTKNQLFPGQLIFSDQYQSSVDGRTHNRAGKLTTRKKIVGGTIFVDAASHYVSLHHQESLTAAETIQSKQQFEQDCLNSGVSIDAYHTDNGVYKSIDFLHELSTNS
jgi:hypothetical protein